MAKIIRTLNSIEILNQINSLIETQNNTFWNLHSLLMSECFMTKVGNLKGYLFWPPFLKVFCQKWKFGRAKEMSASAGIWTQVPRSKGSYAIQWATPLLIENQQKLASYNNFCFGPFLTKNFQKGNGQNRYIFELLTLVLKNILDTK